jgi:hypothetical protein
MKTVAAALQNTARSLMERLLLGCKTEAKLEQSVARMLGRAEAYSTVLPAVSDRPSRNYGPNLGYDYGGRLMDAWLDRGA